MPVIFVHYFLSSLYSQLSAALDPFELYIHSHFRLLYIVSLEDIYAQRVGRARSQS